MSLDNPIEVASTDVEQAEEEQAFAQAAIEKSATDQTAAEQAVAGDFFIDTPPSDFGDPPPETTIDDRQYDNDTGLL